MVELQGSLVFAHFVNQWSQYRPFRIENLRFTQSTKQAVFPFGRPTRTDSMLDMEAYAWWQQGNFLVSGIMGREKTDTINVPGERFEFRIAADGMPALT